MTAWKSEAQSCLTNRNLMEFNSPTKSHTSMSSSVDLLQPKKERKEWPCTHLNCKVILYSKSSRFRHLKLHENPTTQYACSLCPSTFLIKLDLIDHSRRQHSSPDQYVVCDVCDRTFSSVSNLNAHRDIHSRSATPKHRCEVAGCSMSYFHRSALHRHLRNEHRAGHGGSLPTSQTGSLAGSSIIRPGMLSNHAGGANRARSLSSTSTLSGQSSNGSRSVSIFPHNILNEPYTRTQAESSCQYCNEQVAQEGLPYHKHLAFHFLSENRECILNHCRTTLVSKEAYEKHMATHHNM